MAGAEDYVPGQGCLDGDLGRLQVTDLSDQDDVGVLTQEVAQAPSERQVNLRLDLHLHDALEVIFDRVLSREDFHAHIVQFIEDGIEGGGFAAAGRPRAQDDPGRLVDQLVHLFHIVGA